MFASDKLRNSKDPILNKTIIAKGGIKMRVTNRQAKGTTKHNFREFNQDKANHINKDLSKNNQYFWGKKNITLNQIAGLHFSVQRELSDIRDSLRNQDNKNKFDQLTRTQQLELVTYNRLFKDTIKNQNDRHIATRHFNKQRDIIDYYTNKKTEPTEAILQIGNHNEYVPGNQLLDIYKDYVTKHNERYGKNILILNSAFHADEPGAADHTHERKLFIGYNSHGELCSSKTQALKELGFSLPNPNEKESRYNNRLMQYTKECRELWIECCQSHGLDIETIPGDPTKHGLELAKFKADREEQRLYNSIDEHKKQAAEWQKTISENLKKNSKILSEMDKLKDEPEYTRYLEKLALDILYEEFPDTYKYCEEKSINISEQEYSPAEFETDTQNTDDLEI